MRDFATRSPGRWIKLSLSRNDLGNDPDFLKFLMHNIIVVAHELGVDIAALDLCYNQLIEFREDTFAGLTHLQWLSLFGNEFSTLPREYFCWP